MHFRLEEIEKNIYIGEKLEKISDFVDGYQGGNRHFK